MLFNLIELGDKFLSYVGNFFRDSEPVAIKPPPNVVTSTVQILHILENAVPVANNADDSNSSELRGHSLDISLNKQVQNLLKDELSHCIIPPNPTYRYYDPLPEMVVYSNKEDVPVPTEDQKMRVHFFISPPVGVVLFDENKPPSSLFQK